MKRYFAKKIEKKWQAEWEFNKLHSAQSDSSKPKKYVLDMFPYPSGDGLHVGHVKGYVATDILSRYYRLRGFNVLHPMGWDAFGLPAENYAIKKGIHPRITTENNIANIKRQMQMLGLSYDWNREINTTDPEYYRWTQWIFVKMFEQGLAYEAEAPINWCPKDKTGLANEEVVNGKCERCGTEVERKEIRQWILKITAYADRLLEGLKDLEWPQSIKEMQMNWIGRSEGSQVKFDIEGQDYQIEVFTTRVDTIFGVTALILAPEHDKVKDLTTPECRAKVNQYLKTAAHKSDLERADLDKEKTGVFTGSYAINPVSGQKVPIWVADYVIGFYGTGAVMFVPAHDARDREFAEVFDLEILTVVHEESGTLINSGQFDGLNMEDARKKITEFLKQQGKGDFKVNYKLRDWIFSRQRYWGEPIPIVHCSACGVVPVPESELPIRLPDVEKYEPTGTGESPLATIDSWVNTTCPRCGNPAKRETNTMPQWAGSCWYYLRFIDPNNNQILVDKDKEKYWMMVDWYVGGAEHAVLHLLYARFWHKFLYDLGVVTTSEPFYKLTNVGIVLAPDGLKMSKSRGNVVTPDQIVDEYGADTLRMYEAFMGPFENAIAWDPTSINGVYRFLNRVWEVVSKENSFKPDFKIDVALNRLIDKVSQDIGKMKFNTAIASSMEFINFVFNRNLTLEQKKILLKILGPFAPHITEELWHNLGEQSSIHQQFWPEVESGRSFDEDISVAVQVNGKVRDIILISNAILNNDSEVEKIATSSPKVRKYLEGKTIVKTVHVKGKIVSVVTS